MPVVDRPVVAGAANRGIDLSIRPEKLEVFYFEAPLLHPRRNAFGAMTMRPALVVRLTDSSGVQGLGEIFCNWPVFGGRHRAQIITDILAPLVLGATFDTPLHLFGVLSDATRPIVVQCDEPGPFDQGIAGLDLAAWDCLARRNHVPLHRLLSGNADRVTQPAPVYASALTAEQLNDLVPQLRAEGVKGFKLKVGFGLEKDIAALARLRELAGENATLMVDANQRWSLPEALEAASALSDFGVLWIEEPLPATAPLENWRTLAAESPVPLAAGENIRGLERFVEFVGSGILSFVQPDVIKWGGLSQFALIADEARRAGVRLCPHYLGGAIGLLATAHALAANQSDWFELDATENPLRDSLVTGGVRIHGGLLTILDGNGIGAELDLMHCSQYLVYSHMLP